ncbi:MAG: CRTAC1 family protein [Planctomycetes bacterium]|nr:CRTAC1 family protein [Planctomycetota bacterium]
MTRLPRPHQAALLAVLGLAALGLAACTKEPGPAPEADFPRFTDVLSTSGIAFRHDDGFDGLRYRIVETIAGGVAILDADGDGWMDLYFTNGRKIDPETPAPRDALYRNLGWLRFADATEEARLGDEHLSLGVAVADIDGDGDPDLHVTNDGPDRLYRNDGGAFTDVAPLAGVAAESMETGSAFLDMDGDGDLDLYVASYVIDEKRDHLPCKQRGVPGYCLPKDYPPHPDRLYENRGDGTFADVSKASGILDVEPGRGLGVISSDFDDDGRADLYVANDTTANFMFLGDGKGRFAEVGFLNGTAYGEEGGELGSMGVDAADYDADGLVDLCVTNYQDQINNLYRAVKAGESYQDQARFAGITQGAAAEVGWGVGLVDLDQDGIRDLFVANGHLNRRAREINESTAYPQPKRVFRGSGGGRFADVSLACGDAVKAPRVSRGTAFGDLDSDGDLDLVVLDSADVPEVLLNDGGERRSFGLVRLVGSGRNRDAIGARVTLTAGGRTQRAERRSSASYLSANDPRLHFGLGAAARIDRLEVRWPDGLLEAHGPLPANRLITVRRGEREPELTELPRVLSRRKRRPSPRRLTVIPPPARGSPPAPRSRAAPARTRRTGTARAAAGRRRRGSSGSRSGRRCSPASSRSRWPPPCSPAGGRPGRASSGSAWRRSSRRGRRRWSRLGGSAGPGATPSPAA